MKRKPLSDRARIVAELASLGIQFPVSIAIGYFMGKGLDYLFSTKPILTWIFSILGVVAAFVNVFRLNAQLSKIEKETENTDERSEDDQR